MLSFNAGHAADVIVGFIAIQQIKEIVSLLLKHFVSVFAGIVAK